MTEEIIKIIEDAELIPIDNYSQLRNKPSINNVKLEGNKNLEELGIQPLGDYATKEDINDLEINGGYDDTKIKQSLEDLKNNKADKEEIPDITNLISNEILRAELEKKQDKLVSGTNIKTINGVEILGTGNITVQGGSGSASYDDTEIREEINTLKTNKAEKSEIPNIENLASKEELNNYIAKDLYDREVPPLQNEIEFLRDDIEELNGNIPTKTSQLLNDSGYKTVDTNTTYTLIKTDTTIKLVGSDGSETTVTDSDTKIDIVNHLNSTASDRVLSAKQGNVLKNMIPTFSFDETTGTLNITAQE